MKKIAIKDYYKILGVERTASTDEIKRAYHRLARIFHPDKNQSITQKEQEKFSDITEAYNILGNLDNRLKYTVLLNNDKKLIEEIEEKDIKLSRIRRKSKLK